MLKNKYTRFLYQQPDDKGSGAGDAQNTDDKTGNQGGDAGDSSGDPYDDATTRALALEKRLAERDAELKELRGIKTEFEKMREAQQDALKKQGNFEALFKDAEGAIAELSPKAVAYDSLVDQIREQNKTRIASLPSEQQTVVAVLAEKLSPPELRSWLDTAESSILGRPTVGSTGAGRGVAGSGGDVVKLTAEEKALAKAAHMTDEEYAKAKARTQRSE